MAPRFQWRGNLRAPLVAVLLLLTAVDVLAKKKCSGSYSSPVTNLCDKEMTDPDKVWFVLFYTPSSSGCKKIQPKFEKLAKKLSGDADHTATGIGAVDCSQYKDVCQKHGVTTHPTLKGFLAGKAKAYSDAKEFDAMKTFVDGLAKAKGSKGGSSKCEKGPFKSGLKDAVIPMCDSHFPDEGAKNPWIVAFYKMSEEGVQDGLNRIALDFGNEPPEKSKAQKKVKKQRARLTDLAEKYEFEVELPKKGPTVTDAILKVGAVCCDCSEKPPELCAERSGLFFVKAGKQTALKVENYDVGEAVKATLGMMGFVKGVEKKDEL